MVQTYPAPTSRDDETLVNLRIWRSLGRRPVGMEGRATLAAQCRRVSFRVHGGLILVFSLMRYVCFRSRKVLMYK